MQINKEHLKTSLAMSLKDKSYQTRFHIPCNFPDETITAMINESIDDYWKEMNKVEIKPVLFKQFDFSKCKVIGNELLMYEDDLPKNITGEEYSKWFETSKVVRGVRMGNVFIK